MPLISLKNISKSFGKKRVLNGISVDFYLDEFVVILGKSGTGKSTLLNAIDYSLKLDKGKVLFNNESLNKKQISYVKQNYIKRIYQNFNLIDYYNVEDNLKLGNLITNVKTNSYETLLEALKMQDFLNRDVTSLSGGEKQRIAITRSLCNSPLIILADEPTGSLDENSSIEVMKILYKNKKGKCIIMVTHNEEIAYKYADKIIRINENGNIEIEILKGTKQEEVNLIVASNYKVSFINFFKLNIKSLKKRYKSLISMFIITFIMSLALLLFFSLKGGFENYLDEETNNKIDNNLFQIYYQEEGLIKQKNDILEKTNLKYEKEISLTYIFNNLLFDDFYLNGKIIDVYFEISFIKNSELDSNKMYVNKMMEEILKDNKMIVFKNDFINLEINVYEVLEESNLYNSPRIILSFEAYQEALLESGLYDNILDSYPFIRNVYDYYFYEHVDNVYTILNKKKITSFYKVLMQDNYKGYVFNNSLIMLKESFSDLFKTILDLIGMLGVIVIILLAFLVALLTNYALSNRKHELGLIKDSGGNNDTFLKVILSDLLIVFVSSFVLGVVVLMFLSKFIYEHSDKLLKVTSKINLLDISVFEIGKVLGVLNLIMMVVLTFNLFKTNKMNISEVLREE